MRKPFFVSLFLFCALLHGESSTVINVHGGGGSGNVTGPVSSTDNAVVRFDGTTGQLIQNSGVIIDDSNIITAPGRIGVGVAPYNTFDKVSITGSYSGGDGGHPPQYAVNYFNATDNLMDGLTLRRFRGTPASPDFPASGDWLGALLFAGYIGPSAVTDTRSAAGIRGEAAETWSGSVNGASVVVSATPAGDTSRVDVMKIFGSGDVSISSAGHFTMVNSTFDRMTVNQEGGTIVQSVVNFYADNANGGRFKLRKARGTIASPTSVLSGDEMGSLGFDGYGASWVAGGYWRSYATEDWVDGTHRGNKTVMATTPNASDTSVEVLTVDQDGSLASKPDGSAIAFKSTLAGCQIKGTTTNDAASAGYVGQLISASVLVGAPVSLSTATAATITSVSLTAGDWDVSVIACVNGTLTGTQFLAAASENTNSLTGTVLGDTQVSTASLSTAAADNCQTLPAVRKSYSSTTSVYLVEKLTFTVGTAVGYGRISARRVR